MTRPANLPKIVACLSWYDEPTSSLGRCVRSLAGIADTVFALDGAYAAFPGAEERPTSPPEQYDAIMGAARFADVTLELGARQDGPWPGGEVEKRARLLEHGVELAGPDGWLLVIDGDEHTHRATYGWRDELATTTRDAAEVEFRDGTDVVKARRFFRALPGLTVENAHYRYVTGDGRVLWGNLNEPQEPTLDLSGAFALQHRPERTEERQERRRAYYRRRNSERLETVPCLCGQPAIHWVAADLRAAAGGRIDAGWRAVCEECEPAAVAEAVAQARRLRVDKQQTMMIARKRMPI